GFVDVTPALHQSAARSRASLWSRDVSGVFSGTLYPIRFEISKILHVAGAHSNPNNVKRTWQQVKVKYKNIVQCANRKRAQKQMLGGGLSASGFTHAEEMALWQIRGRPMMDGIAWAGSSEQAGSGVRSPSSTEAESSGPLIQPVPTIIDSAEEPIDHSDSDHDEKNIVVCSHSDEGNDAFTGHEEPGPSGPFRHAEEESDEDVTSLYKRYLRQEIAYRQLKMKKLEKEIQLLDKQLDVS
ncbi:hypothetical protein NFI96_017375, partial [Prochilodus magdalenae]